MENYGMKLSERLRSFGELSGSALVVTLDDIRQLESRCEEAERVRALAEHDAEGYRQAMERMQAIHSSEFNKVCNERDELRAEVERLTAKPRPTFEAWHQQNCPFTCNQSRGLCSGGNYRWGRGERGRLPPFAGRTCREVYEQEMGK